jgi:hypothetical protein
MTMLQSQKLLRTFVPITLSKAESGTCDSGPKTGLVAALPTRMSIRPHARIVPSTRF